MTLYWYRLSNGTESEGRWQLNNNKPGKSPVMDKKQVPPRPLSLTQQISLSLAGGEAKTCAESEMRFLNPLQQDASSVATAGI